MCEENVQDGWVRGFMVLIQSIPDICLKVQTFSLYRLVLYILSTLGVNSSV